MTTESFLIRGDAGPQSDSMDIETVPTDERLSLAASGDGVERYPHRAEWQRSYARRVHVTDTVVVTASVFVGAYVRFGVELSSPPLVRYMSYLSPLVIACWLIALAATRTRSPRITGMGIEEYRRVVAATFVTFGAIAIVSLLFKVPIARAYLAIALPLGLIALLAGRMFWRHYAFRQRTRGQYRARVLIVGEHEEATHFASELTRGEASGYDIAGVMIPKYGGPRNEFVTIGGVEVPILGDERHVLEAITRCDADTVAIAGTEHFGVRGIRRLIWDLEPRGVDLMVSTGIMDIALSRLVMRPTSGIPVMHIEKPQYQGAKRFQKRLFDILFSVVALIVAMPILVTAAIAIVLTSKGPIFYRAERIGIDGKPFSMFKFRTMVVNADALLGDLLRQNESDGLLFKMRDDPRITPVGRILRRLSIDELPQFFNVIIGNMSVVGPRPPLRREVDAYDCDVSRRLLVKPGITGLWQVSGRSDLTWDEAVRLDLSYVDNWSMVGDVLIAAKTVAAVTRRQGAY